MRCLLWRYIRLPVMNTSRITHFFSLALSGWTGSLFTVEACNDSLIEEIILTISQSADSIKLNNVEADKSDIIISMSKYSLAKKSQLKGQFIMLLGVLRSDATTSQKRL